jgi:excisionase family DNA binding protein
MQQQMLQQQLLQQQQAAAGGAQPAQPAAPAATPDVMTPEQAAAVLQVSVDDVMAAIDGGELKAKKIGSSYRISKANLDEFLAG